MDAGSSGPPFNTLKQSNAFLQHWFGEVVPKWLLILCYPEVVCINHYLCCRVQSVSCIDLDAVSISLPLSLSVSFVHFLPVCGLSVSAAAAVMFILSATPPPPGTTQALLGTFTRDRGSTVVPVGHVINYHWH